MNPKTNISPIIHMFVLEDFVIGITVWWFNTIVDLLLRARIRVYYGKLTKLISDAAMQKHNGIMSLNTKKKGEKKNPKNSGCITQRLCYGVVVLCGL